MTTRQQIKANFLRALLAADGIAMPDEALISAVREMTFPTPTLAEIMIAEQELELKDGLISGAKMFTGLSWSLTVQGVHQANQLR